MSIDITLVPFACQFRLTLESGVPVSTSDQTSKTNVYWTPYNGNRVTIFNGTYWRTYTSTELTLALGTLTSGKNYDVFVYDNAGTLTLELSSAWTSDTARNDALTTQDGVYVKSGATTRLHLGKLRTTSTTTTQTTRGGSTTQVGGKWFLENRYNRVPIELNVIDTADTWNYTTNTWRVSNGATAPLNCVEFLAGDTYEAVDAVAASVVVLASNSARAAQAGVGVNSSTAPSGLRGATYNASASGMAAPSEGKWRGQPRLGYNFLSWLEKGADGTCIFSGDNGGDGRQAGLTATIWG